MDRFVGQSVIRKDAYEKISGAATYAFDLDNIPNTLICKFLASPKAHAKIISIDTSKAESLSGVVAVVTGKDWPIKIGLYAGDRDILAVEKVVWVGQPVVAVAAETEALADEV